jgi:mono/diheme cytochrome c family protein
MKRIVLTLVVFVALLAAAAYVFMSSGLYDVSATAPDKGVIRWALVTTQRHSVHRAVAAIQGKIPVPNLEDPQRIKTGLVHYHQMCTPCHGAPGVNISEIGQGLNPDPPELSDAAHDPPEETFWVVKNGIKMTGMPAFGVTHTDDEVWAIVAFVRRMAKLSPPEYKAMVEQAGMKLAAGEAGEGHGEEKMAAPAAAPAPVTPPK